MVVFKNSTQFRANISRTRALLGYVYFVLSGISPITAPYTWGQSVFSHLAPCLVALAPHSERILFTLALGIPGVTGCIGLVD
jgi:hypothetical protein